MFAFVEASHGVTFHFVSYFRNETFKKKIRRRVSYHQALSGRGRMTASLSPTLCIPENAEGSGFQITAAMAVGLLLLAALCWGAGNVANKTLLEHVGPFTALVVRCLLALGIILPLCRLDGERQSGRAWLSSALLVSLLFAAALMAQQAVYRWTTVTNVSFLVNTCTVMTALVTWIFLRQRPSGGVAIAGLVTVLGAYLMSGATVTGATMNPGDLACFVSALCYAGWMVALGYHVVHHGCPMATSAVQFALTAALMLPLSLTFEAPTPSGVAAAWRELLFLGVFSTAAACALTTVAQQHVSAPVTAILVSMESLFGAAGGYLILGEQTTTAGLFGGALIFCAVGVTAFSDRVAHRGQDLCRRRPRIVVPLSPAVPVNQHGGQV